MLVCPWQEHCDSHLGPLRRPVFPSQPPRKNRRSIDLPLQIPVPMPERRSAADVIIVRAKGPVQDQSRTGQATARNAIALDRPAVIQREESEVSSCSNERAERSAGPGCSSQSILVLGVGELLSGRQSTVIIIARASYSCIQFSGHGVAHSAVHATELSRPAVRHWYLRGILEETAREQIAARTARRGSRLAGGRQRSTANDGEGLELAVELE